MIPFLTSNRDVRPLTSTPPLHKKKEETRLAQERKEKKWQKDHAYDDIFTEDSMDASSNQNREVDWEDDFM